jgi:cob(I)alamin adenosyltransferase
MIQPRSGLEPASSTKQAAHISNRLTPIATRTGDDGTTGLGDGNRVSKDSLRVHAMGDVDELNSQLGVLLAEPLPVTTTSPFSCCTSS